MGMDMQYCDTGGCPFAESEGDKLTGTKRLLVDVGMLYKNEYSIT